MKEIPLTNSNRVTLIDDEDYENVSKYRWYLTPDGYVKSSSLINGKQPSLHRFILSTPEGFDTDHINHDLLDNRRKNLRIATRSQNMANSLKHKNNTSQFKGVYWHKGAKKWQAQITPEGKNIYLGYFTSEIKAATAYDLAALKYFREFSRLNFPERITIE